MLYSMCCLLIFSQRKRYLHESNDFYADILSDVPVTTLLYKYLDSDGQEVPTILVEALQQ